MPADNPTKTLADYLVIAISPILLMVLVHSVCFFLVEIFYRSSASTGVQWVLFWFVLAVVLIARIGIEQGAGHALGYGLGLAGAVWLYLSFVQFNPVFGAVLLGVVWFTAHKLTCNCTLIDEDEDASGQGLMSSLGRLPAWLKKKVRPPALPVAAAPAQTGGITPPAFGPKTPGSPRLARSSTPAAAPARKKAAAEVPGLWLIYYSLAALPLFGLGQTLLPAGDLAARHLGFIHLFCYLAAALGLMVTTSFLGLRRHLRQRYLAMPDAIALGWVKFGVATAVVVLGLSLLLPRPGAGEAWGSLRYHVDYQLRRASEYAAKFNPHGTGAGKAGSQKPAENPADNPSGPSGAGTGSSQNETPQTGAPNSPQPGPGADQNGPAGQTGEAQPENSPPSLSPAAAHIYSWLKVLFWLAAAIGLVWLIIRYRTAMAMFIRSIGNAIRDFIAALLGLVNSATASPAAALPTLKKPSFRAFKNPFLSGGDRIWPPETLVTYTYDALQSWVREQPGTPGSPRTPREFCRQLAEELPQAAGAFEHLALLYGHVAYGVSLPGNYEPAQLRELWECMAGPPPQWLPVPITGKAAGEK